ncbi:MAG: metal-dependent hydrolase [Sulfitobacter sp.]|nr:metal-dependent hydrolase [Sulfitobacter sp.]
MSQSVIRLASYNIRKARGLDQKRRPGRTLDVINGLDADLVVLQEADRRLGQRRPAIPRKMIEKGTDFDLVPVSRNGISLGFHGNAILVRKGLKVEGIDQIDLPGLEPRGAVGVHLSGGLTIVAAHLGLRRKDRRDQLERVIERVSENAHVAIAGDFNEWSEDRGLEPLEQRFQTHAPGHSFHARRPVAALDRVALSRGLELHDGGVDEGALARRASDHLPIWTDIALPAGVTC